MFVRLCVLFVVRTVIGPAHCVIVAAKRCAVSCYASLCWVSAVCCADVAVRSDCSACVDAVCACAACCLEPSVSLAWCGSKTVSPSPVSIAVYVFCSASGVALFPTSRACRLISLACYATWFRVSASAASCLARGFLSFCFVQPPCQLRLQLPPPSPRLPVLHALPAFFHCTGLSSFCC